MSRARAARRTVRGVPRGTHRAPVVCCRAGLACGRRTGRSKGGRQFLGAVELELRAAGLFLGVVEPSAGGLFLGVVGEVRPRRVIQLHVVCHHRRHRCVSALVEREQSSEQRPAGEHEDVPHGRPHGELARLFGHAAGKVPGNQPSQVPGNVRMSRPHKRQSTWCQ